MTKGGLCWDGKVNWPAGCRQGPGEELQNKVGVQLFGSVPSGKGLGSTDLVFA